MDIQGSFTSPGLKKTHTAAHPAASRTLADIHRGRDYLTHEKLWVAFHASNTVGYRHASFLFTPGRWRGYEWADVRTTPTSATTLVIGHSDLAVSELHIREIRTSSSYRSVFATNLEHDATLLPGVFDLPLGLPNDERQSRTHIVQGDDSLLYKAWKRGNNRSTQARPRIYANFSVRTNPPVRSEVLGILKGLPDVSFGSFSPSRKGRLKDLEEMSHCGIVVCPRGGGLDTHRVWEALMVGAFPAVLTSDHSARLLRALNLPHIALESWNDLQDSQAVEREFVRCQSQEWDYSGVTASFWIERISASTSRLLPAQI